ncbi:MAG: prolyl oligopeptidase family serine peptidase [Bacteroidota bacterium]
MKKAIITFLFIQFIWAVGFSQKCRVLAVKSSRAPYNYWVCTPDNYNADTTYKWPVFVFLHGRSLSGTDLNLVKKYGLIAEVEKGRRFPAIIIAPQVLSGESWNADKVIQCLDELERKYRIDTNRIAITGMSLGGYGTLNTAGKYPNKFCAAAAFCGGGNKKDACNLSTIPVWVAHGKKDEKVPFAESYEIVNRIKICSDANIRFTVFEEHNHGALERMFRTEELYDFMLKNEKGKETYFPEFKRKSLTN